MEFYTKGEVDKIIDGVTEFLAEKPLLEKEKENVSYLATGKSSTIDIQKQIEATKGLIEVHNNLTSIVMTRYGGDGEFEDEISTLKDSIRTLTETLKPYLGDDKLEV